MNGIHEVTGSIPVWSTNLSFPASDRPQVAEGRCGYAVPTKPFPSNAIPSGKNSCWNRCRCSSDACTQQVGGARQNAFCERQDALYVEFIELAGVRSIRASVSSSRSFSAWRS